MTPPNNQNVRAQMRVIIKRILRKPGYPPDKQARVTELVMEQAEALCREFSSRSRDEGWFDAPVAQRHDGLRTIADPLPAGRYLRIFR
ncbi:MAG TPA: type I restriction enzyme endonuclease domain-containing protein [Tepidisphaeraceae bacterium]|nr:type I restriction enzyme endonuclease domain-containing protein [Tepidisphaeraceae bacterium]